MPKQLVNIRLFDENFDHTFPFNIYKKSGDKIHIIMDDITTIDLEVKFFKLPNGLIECRIFQEFESGKKRIVYRKSVTNLIEPWKKCFDTYIISNNGHKNIKVNISITDDNGNKIGKYKLISSRV